MPPDGYESVSLPVSLIELIDERRRDTESRAAYIHRAIELHPDDLTVTVRESARKGVEDALESTAVR